MAIGTPEQFLQLQSPGTSAKSRIFDPTTMASATTIAPTYYMTVVSGTTAIVNITIPYDDFAGSIELLPTGAFTWTAAGNIAVLGTAVVARALRFTYNPNTVKWYPSYV
jgi:hypothetical protein